MHVSVVKRVAHAPDNVINPSVSVSALMTLLDFTLSKARRFYSSMGNPSDTEGLKQISDVF